MIRTRTLAGWTGALLAGAALALTIPLVARAADAMKEVSTAAQHAGYAAGSKELKMVHAHLHHTINCLVGPKGMGFDAKQLNPCKDMGNGAIPDTADAMHKKELEAAVAKAEYGLKENELSGAQKAAAETAAMLKKASMM
jgi:hypothetical protein